MQPMRRNPGWLVFAGALTILLGMAAIAVPALASLATALFVGWLLLLGGVARVLWSASWLRGWDVAAGVASGLLAAVIGLFVVLDPVDGLLGLTLALGLLFFGTGIAQALAALAARPTAGWGFALFHGAASVLLGAVIVTGWPVSGLWVIGLLVGLELLIQGLRYVGFAAGLRAIRRGDGEVAGGITAPDARPTPRPDAERTTG